jgi:hypothetical protein
MGATFGDQKSVLIVDENPEPGRFALYADPPKQPSWEKCREKFAAMIKPETPGFLFSHSPTQGTHVAGFLSKSEDILDLNLRSVYSLTDRENVLWVEPARFWMDCWIRRSLLTILLRCGMYYDCGSDNYEDALFGKGDEKDQAREYTNRTKPAVMRFMFGFTKFVMPEGMSEPTGVVQSKIWVDVFNSKTTQELKSILVAETPMPCFGRLGADAIWA